MNPVQSDTPQTLEQLNQGFGYLVYIKRFKNPVKGKLELEGLRDFAIIYINHQKACVLNRYYNNYCCQIDVRRNATLDILLKI